MASWGRKSSRTEIFQKHSCKSLEFGSKVNPDNLSDLQAVTRTHGTPESRDSGNSLSRESPGFLHCSTFWESDSEMRILQQNGTEMAKLYIPDGVRVVWAGTNVPMSIAGMAISRRIHVRRSAK
jgi:hypothetical protein